MLCPYGTGERASNTDLMLLRSLRSGNGSVPATPATRLFSHARKHSLSSLYAKVAGGPTRIPEKKNAACPFNIKAVCHCMYIICVHTVYSIHSEGALLD